MRFFVFGGAVPSARHGVRAANMVLCHLIRELGARGHQVILQLILNEPRRPWSREEANSLAELASWGCDVLEPLFASDYMLPPEPGSMARLSRQWERLTHPIAYFFPAVRLEPQISRRLKDAAADVTLIVWNSEGMAATYGNHSLPKVAYLGMPDHAAALARLEDPELFGHEASPLPRALARRYYAGLAAQHWLLMRDCDVVGNLSADHAAYYRARGHPRSVYLPNLWPEPRGELIAQPPSLAAKPKILGSLGRPAATGNTYGLRYIAQELVPRLDAALGPEGYEIHVVGAGEPVERVRDLLRRARSVIVRGWVEDIDGEIRSAHLFLVANNTDRYRGSHTRFLHAWSLKACPVAHSYNAQANPEMVHAENVLLGETPGQMVEMILKAIREPETRRRIGEEGFQTWKRHFTPCAVVGKLLVEVESLMTTGSRTR